MKNLNNFSVSVLALVAAGATLLAGCSAQPPVKSESARLGCEQLGDAPDYLAPGKVSAVRKVTRTEHVARALQVERTAGADVFVNAEPGLTPDYLQRAISCQADAGSATARLLGDERAKVAISVRSDAGRLAVRATSSDHRVAERLWERANALTQPAVTVEQVATLGGSSF